MESIVQEALKHSKKDKLLRESIKSDTTFEEFGTPHIVIVGCGGAGNNTINRLYNLGVTGSETIAINTDKQHLEMTKADKKILIGQSLTRGLGAGGYPDVGRKSAELGRGTIDKLLKNADLVFITAGMGGGTGTGTAPVVADIAKQNGAIVICIVSTPFRVERARSIKAEEGLENLRQVADTLIILDNNRLLDYVPNLPIEQAFSVMDQLIAETIKAISETITGPSLNNLDYADVKKIMGCGGVAVMLVGEGKNQNRSDSVVRAALNHPLLDVDYRGATGCLVHIIGGPDLTFQEAVEVAESITSELDGRANVILGAKIKNEYEGRIRVLAIMTGVQSAKIIGPTIDVNNEKRKNNNIIYIT